MKKLRTIHGLLAAALVAACAIVRCANLTGGTETGDARTIGLLRYADGSPAAHVQVKVTRWSGNPREGDVTVDRTETDRSGCYRFDSLPADTYNFLGSGSGLLSYFDSIVVPAVGAQTRVPPDTLKAAGSVSGRVVLQPGDDPRGVLLLFLGTNTWTTPGDSLGNFTVKNMPEGDFRVQVMATTGNYYPETTAVSVTAGHAAALPSPITLTCPPPPPESLSASYDTLNGCVKLTWSPVLTGSTGYIIFRNDPASPVPEKLTQFPIGGTSYVDTVFHNLMDTADRAFTYRIKTWEKGTDLTSVFSKPVTVGAPSPTNVRTFITWQSMHTVGDSASINDTVSLIVHYKNATRKNIMVQWFINSKYSLKHGTEILAFSGSDTLRVAWGEPSRNTIYTAITDEALTAWWDSTSLTIVTDAPLANAGNDTILSAGDTVRLRGSATQKFGTIVKWEWKIGPGAWSATSGPDTMAIMPATEPALLCSLAVTDDDGNRAVDGMKAVIGGSVAAIAAGNDYSLFLSADGTLWACGSNGEGQLGDGTTADRSTPVQVMTGVQGMDAGISHSMILKADGSLWTCGFNKYGQLGTGDSANRMVPERVMSGVQNMDANGAHSLILEADGSLWACGLNDAGQLGDGTTIDRSAPVQVMTGVRRVAAGGSHNLLLKTDGSLWACGSYPCAKPGGGTTMAGATPLQVMAGVQSMSAGVPNNLLVKTDGTLWTSFYRIFGKTANPDNQPEQVMTDIRDASIGTQHAFAIKTDGSLWATGDNAFGVLCDGTTTNKTSPVRVMTGVLDVSAGGSHTLILKTDGTLWACGSNKYGQLGDGTTTDRHAPVQIQLPEK